MSQRDHEIIIEADKLSKMFVLKHRRGLKQRLFGFFDSRFNLGSEVRAPFYAVSDVSFTLRKGESLALLGHNGAGKSTLLQLICGILKPSAGTVKVAGRIAPLIALGVGFHPELTGIENIYLNSSLLGRSNQQTRDCFDDIVDFSELGEFIDVPVKNYSSGMYMRLGLSIAVHAAPQILLADEVLTVGDASFQEKCIRRIQEMQSEGMALILVTHSREQAQQFCQRFITLERGRVVEQGEFAAAADVSIYPDAGRKFT